MAKITIETGKTYACRNGETFTAAKLTGDVGVWAVAGVDSRGRVCYRSIKGRFLSYPHPLDVVRELA